MFDLLTVAAVSVVCCRGHYIIVYVMLWGQYVIVWGHYVTVYVMSLCHSVSHAMRISIYVTVYVIVYVMLVCCSVCYVMKVNVSQCMSCYRGQYVTVYVML